MSNTKDIVDAYKKHLHKNNEIQELHKKIRTLHEKMFAEDIPAIIKIYGLVFKNIHTDKKEVCNIENFRSDDYSDYYDKDNYLRKLFLNRDGFSVSDTFLKSEEKELNVSRTNYAHIFGQKGFIKLMKRLLEHKAEILSVMDKEYKKSIVIRFLDALEKSGCNTDFDGVQDYDYLKEDLKDKNLEFEYYNDGKIEKKKISFFMLKNASQSIQVHKERGSYGSSVSIELHDLERCSQVYDELVAFLNKYYEHLYKQDMSLLKFVVLLRDAFARELIVDALKDKQDVK